MKARKPKLIVIGKTRPASRLRVEEWRKSPFMVKEAQRVLADPTMAAMLDVLRQESPANHMLPGGQSEVDALRQLGRVEGAQMILNTIEQMGVLIEEPPFLEATFEEEQSPTQED